MIVSNDVITQANQHIIGSNELMGELSVSTFPSSSSFHRLKIQPSSPEKAFEKQRFVPACAFMLHFQSVPVDWIKKKKGGKWVNCIACV